MVVYFTIENNYIAPIKGLHRLMSGGRQIDDREPAVAENGELVAPKPIAQDRDGIAPGRRGPPRQCAG